MYKTMETNFDDDYFGNIKLNDVIHYPLSQFNGGVVHGITRLGKCRA